MRWLRGLKSLEIAGMLWCSTLTCTFPSSPSPSSFSMEAPPSPPLRSTDMCSSKAYTSASSMSHDVFIEGWPSSSSVEKGISVDCAGRRLASSAMSFAWLHSVVTNRRIGRVYSSSTSTSTSRRPDAREYREDVGRGAADDGRRELLFVVRPVLGLSWEKDDGFVESIREATGSRRCGTGLSCADPTDTSGCASGTSVVDEFAVVWERGECASPESSGCRGSTSEGLRFPWLGLGSTVNVVAAGIVVSFALYDGERSMSVEEGDAAPELENRMRGLGGVTAIGTVVFDADDRRSLLPAPGIDVAADSRLRVLAAVCAKSPKGADEFLMSTPLRGPCGRSAEEPLRAFVVVLTDGISAQAIARELSCGSVSVFTPVLTRLKPRGVCPTHLSLWKSFGVVCIAIGRTTTAALE
eukprot:PhM_4_TR12607/c0_g1_i1/m.86963